MPLISKTLVIQSHRLPLPHTWIENCLESVRCWCELNAFEYRFMCDELFDCVPEDIITKTLHQRVIASDLARLIRIQEAIKNGYERVIWLDADFLIFDAIRFVLPDEFCAVGREVWIQQDKHGRLKAYKKVHNAFLMFCKGNSLLNFYADTAERLLEKNNGAIPAQFIGPKLLTAIHNVAILPVMETAGMLSPMVVRDMLQGQGPALDLFIRHSAQAIAAANLCISSCERDELTENEMVQLIDLLKNKRQV
ncbi:MAG: hypothetical protein ACN4GR_05890 [Arenicellales bacterium]